MTTTNDHGIDETYEQAVADVEPEFTETREAYQINYVRGLRELADFLEKHPKLVPSYGGETINVFAYTKKDLAEMAREMGTCEKLDQDYWFTMRKKFPPHKFDLNITREKVCTKVKTGTRVVEKPDPDALKAVPRISVEEDIYEWKCPESVLAPDLPEDLKCDDDEA